MASAMRCDRCGKYYDKNHKVVEYESKRIHLRGINFVIYEYRLPRGYRDLCDDCLDLVCELLNITNTLDEPGLNVTDD